jgi:DNA-binding response OmpR family regulator
VSIVPAIKGVPQPQVGRKVQVLDPKHRIVIDEEKHEFLLDGIEIHLAPKEFMVIALLKRVGKTMSRAELLEKVWGLKKASHMDVRTVDQHIARLRQKLTARGVLGTNVIKTQNSFGYMYKQV